MAFDYQHLIGLPYREGTADCYGLIRRFYQDVFSIDLPNFARPTGWDAARMNLLARLYHPAGFRVLDCHPSEYKPGDIFLMGIRNTTSNHAGILVERGLLLHHLYRSLSKVDRYSGLWRNTTLAALRHKDDPYKERGSTEDLMHHLPVRTREKLAALARVPDPGK